MSNNKDNIDRLREALVSDLAATVRGAFVWGQKQDNDRAAAALDALVARCEQAERERDEAQDALQSLAADHYFARAEAAEAALDAARNALRETLDAVEKANVSERWAEFLELDRESIIGRARAALEDDGELDLDVIR